MSIPFQSMQPVPRVYTLPRSRVELYTTGDGDTLGSLVWTAYQVDNLRVHEAFTEVLQFYTGVPYPETHHTLAIHEISFDAIWNVGAKLQRNTEYILAITWQDASLGTGSQSYVRRFYGGVTTSSRDIGSREANEFGSGNVLKAKFYSETVGGGSAHDAGGNPVGDPIAPTNWPGGPTGPRTSPPDNNGVPVAPDTGVGDPTC